MIKSLYIKNFVLIDELSIDFTDGFDAFIGETGAGKSIFIDAISLFLKERASSSLISKGQEKAIVEAIFDLTNNESSKALLEDAGIDLEEGMIFTREISANGKSIARINHRPVTVKFMNECLDNEIDIHNQRDHQYLLKPNIHIDLLDEYLGLITLKRDVKNLFQNYQSLVKEKEEVLSQKFNESDLEFFEYQVREIEDAKLEIGEDEELEKKEKSYHAIKDSIESIQQILSTYQRISDDLFFVEKQLDHIDESNQFTQIHNQFRDSYYEMEDAIQNLQKSTDFQDLDEATINEMEERLFLIQKMKRKYGNTIEEILGKKEDLQKQIEQFTNRQAYLEEMDRKIEQALSEYMKVAKQLSKKRREGKKSLEKEIIHHLKDLALPNANFSVQMESIEPTSKGIDQVEFFVNMNPGEDLKPLVKVASGGEISRLMLGLKTIFAKLQKIETMIFDEIDAGVSGAVATAIGGKMKELSKNCQVFAVTHLAPVASCADSIYFVEKTQEKNHSSTTVKQLTKEEEVQQLAYLSSGELTDASLEAARELRIRNQEL